MVLLIAGSSHTGKTLAAQRVLEKYKIPYLSLDHLKMGLIRSHMTDITVNQDDEVTKILWPMVKEIIKTAIENKQNLTIEGCYLPFDWEKDFEEEYRKEIRFVCLILSKEYIEKNYELILDHANDIENRLDESWVTKERLIRCNGYHLLECRKHKQEYILIENEYKVDIEIDLSTKRQ